MTTERHRQSAYTLVEVLVAATLTLMLMGAVVTVFSGMGNSINASRAALETFDRLRATVAMLRNDLDGITVTMQPPRRPDDNEGYFELIEGPFQGPRVVAPNPQPQAVNSELNNQPDLTVDDNDDMLLFTTRSTTRSFSGRHLNAAGAIESIESDVAEVAWFVRGRTLHRRVLLVVPNVLNLMPYTAEPKYFFQTNDISARIDSGKLVGNTLGDLTKRECRFAHPYFNPGQFSQQPPSGSFPYDVRWWGALGLPTLREWTTTKPDSWLGGWTLGTTPVPGKMPSGTPAVPPPTEKTADYWRTIAWDKEILPDYYLCPQDPSDSTKIIDGTRVADDVVLTNVIGFDVKVWEPHGNPQWQPGQNFVPGSGAYMDLGWMTTPYSQDPTANPYPFLFFHHLGNPLSGLNATPVLPARVYDTFSTHYENEGRFTDDPAGRATNGMNDDTTNGIVDGATEAISAPPYAAPLRGIQIKIRVFEPDSRQIREVTIVHDFLPK